MSRGSTNDWAIFIILESKQIADALGALFDLAWEGADKYKNT